MIKHLDNNFDGIGEVKGFKFQKIDTVYSSNLYKVLDSYGNIHYEVFKPKSTPICVDFKNRIYSDTDSKEVYPKSKDFGIWAWTYKFESDAIKKMHKLELENK